MTRGPIEDFAMRASDVGTVHGQYASRHLPAVATERPSRGGVLFWTLCIAVVGVPLVWSQFVFNWFDIPKTSLFFIVVSAGIAFWSSEWNRGLHLTLPRASGDRAGVAFLFLAALSLLWAYSPALGLVTLLRLLTLAAFYALLIVALDSERRVARLLRLMLGTMGVVAAYGLFQFYDVYNHPGEGRPFLLSTLGHPNHASNYVGMGLPLLFALSLTSRGWRRWLAFAGLCLSFAFILAAQTRSVWVAILVALGIGGFLAILQPVCREQLLNARKSLIVLLASCLVLILVFCVENPLNRRIAILSRAAGVVTSESGEHVTVGSRWLVWKATWLLIREHPLLGVGIGNFPSYSAEYLARTRQASTWVDPRYRTEFFLQSHNDYLQLLAELGPSGPVMLLWFVGWHLTLVRRRLKSAEIAGHEALHLTALVAAVLVFFVDAIFSLPFSMIACSLTAMALLASLRRTTVQQDGAAFAARDRHPKEEPASVPPRGIWVARRPATAVALGVSTVLSAWAGALFVANVFYLRGEEAVNKNAYLAAAPWYEKAVRANPLEWRYRLGLGVGYLFVFRNKEALQSARQAETFLKRGSTADTIGFAYYRLGDFDRAQAEYRRALWYELDRPQLRENMVALLLDQKRYAEAAKEATEGIRWSPDYGRLHLQLATAEAGLGRTDLALASAQTAADILPSDHFVFILLQDLGSRTGRQDVVESATRRLRAIAQYEASHMLRSGGTTNPQPAALLRSVSAADPQYPDPHFELGMIRQEQGAVQEAIAEFSIYLRLAPRGERAHQAQRFITSLQYPSWLVNTFGLDARFFE